MRVAATWVNASRVLPLLTIANVKNPSIIILKDERNKIFKKKKKKERKTQEKQRTKDKPKKKNKKREKTKKRKKKKT